MLLFGAQRSEQNGAAFMIIAKIITRESRAKSHLCMQLRQKVSHSCTCINACFVTQLYTAHSSNLHRINFCFAQFSRFPNDQYWLLLPFLNL
jgi:hypothetical protein